MQRVRRKCFPLLLSALNACSAYLMISCGAKSWPLPWLYLATQFVHVHHLQTFKSMVYPITSWNDSLKNTSRGTWPPSRNKCMKNTQSWVTVKTLCGIWLRNWTLNGNNYKIQWRTEQGENALNKEKQSKSWFKKKDPLHLCRCCWEVD